MAKRINFKDTLYLQGHKVEILGKGGLRLPIGNDIDRPDIMLGMIRYNFERNQFEFGTDQGMMVMNDRNEGTTFYSKKGGVLDGPLIIKDDRILNGNGSGTMPAYSFYSDPDTGIFHPAEDSLSVILGGTVNSTPILEMSRYGTDNLEQSVIIHGDLIVEGAQTIINSQVLSVEDNVITLNKGGSAIGYSGIEIESDALIVANLRYHFSTGRWDIDGDIITNSAIPTLDSDLTNKIYVDTQISEFVNDTNEEIERLDGRVDSTNQDLLDHKNAIDPHPQYTTEQQASDAAPIQSVNTRVGDIVLDNTDVGLGNVQNSDTTNAVNITSGILPGGRFDDTTHGDRSGGSLHSLATQSIHGFMSSQDKLRLDTVEDTAPVQSVNTRVGDIVLDNTDVGLGNVQNSDTTNAVNITSGILPGGRFDDTTHGDRSGGSLHSLVTQSIHGFMSSQDKLRLDTVEDSAPVQSVNTRVGDIVLDNTDVGLGNVQNSDTTNAVNITSGILPGGRFDDTTHGDRSGGSLHSLATQSIHGFMSSQDKLRLDTVEDSAPVQSVNTRVGDIVLDNTDVGLGNVDNTSDANKPVSILQDEALDLKSDVGHKHPWAADITDKPVGIEGQVYYFTEDGSDFVSGDFILKTGRFVENAGQMSEEQVGVRSLDSLVDTWHRFSHDGEVQPAAPDEMDGWRHDQGTTTIYNTVNSTTYIGIVSDAKYDTYDHTLTVTATGVDNDVVGAVIAFATDENDMVSSEDPDGYTWDDGTTVSESAREYTLSVLRSRTRQTAFDINNISSQFAIVYNYKKTDSAIILDGDALVWETTNNYTHVDPAGANCNLRIERRGDVVEVWTTDWDDSPTYDGSWIGPLVIDLKDNVSTERFSGLQSYGYSAHSQENATFYNMDFNNPIGNIYDIENNAVLSYVNDNWVVQPNSLVEEIGTGRFITNDRYHSLYFIQDDITILKILDNESMVSSVNGKSGAVLLDNTDVGLNNVRNIDTTDAANITSGILLPGRFNDTTHGNRSGGSLHSLATSTTHGFMSAADKARLDDASSTAPIQSVNTRTGDIVLNKTDVGLSNVDDTSDANKPVSILQKEAIDKKIPIAEKGVAGGVATLNSNAQIPSSQLPPLAITETHAVTTIAARDLLIVQEGDVAIVQDDGFGFTRSYIYDKQGNWLEISTPGNVKTVNGYDGTVVLDNTDVGLGNVQNSDTTNAVNITSGILPAGRFNDTTHGDRSGGSLHSLATPATHGFMSSQDKVKLDDVSSTAPVQSVNTRVGDIVLTNTDVGLGNVDNTSDANKPVSILQEEALDLKSDTGHNHSWTNDITGKPFGERGQYYHFATDDGVTVTGDYILDVGRFVDGPAQLLEEQEDVTTFEEIVQQWYRFSHGSTTAGHEGISDVQPAEPSETNAWFYDSENDQVFSTINSPSHIGFVSEDRYDSYFHELKMSASGGDNDMIGTIAAFSFDENDMVPNNAFGLNPDDFAWDINVVDEQIPKEHSLTVMRTRTRQSLSDVEGVNSQFAIVYNYKKTDNKILANGDGLVWDTSLGFGTPGAFCGIRVERAGDIIKVWTTDWNDAPDYDASWIGPLEVDLRDYPETDKLRGAGSYGYSAHSQDGSTFYDISFLTPGQNIYDISTDTRWVYINNEWQEDATTISEDFGVGKFIINDDYNYLFYVKDDETIIKVLDQVQNIDTTNAANITSGILSGGRFDDTTHGNRSGGSLHSLATPTTHGFMSSQDKDKMDNIPASDDLDGRYVQLAGDTMTGKLTLATVTRRDVISLNDMGTAHNIGWESHHNTYGPSTWDSGTIGHKFIGSADNIIAVIGAGGTTTNANTSTFYGDVSVSDENATTYGGTDGTGAKFAIQYNATSESLDFNFLG